MSDDYLSGFETIVLLALLRVGEDAYGVPILREIEDCSDRQIAVGSVYAALERLERKGFVTSRWGEPTAERGGRARKHFTVTARGLKEMRRTQQTLTRLWQGVPGLQRVNE